MDWIKKNYDKLLLALFGLFALVVGALQLMGGSEDETANKKITEKSELGPDKSEETKKALADLSANVGKAVWSPLKTSEHRTAHLFTASPVVQKAGIDQPVALLDDAAPEMREGVPNWWLYENGLKLERDDILSFDTDGDKFSNKEEWEGKSNPRDPDSRPAFWAKLRLIEILEDKYEIRNRGIEGTPDKPEIQLSRLQPLGPNGKVFGKLDYHVGDVAFDDDKRFKIVKVEDREIVDATGQKSIVKHVVLTDSKNPAGAALAIPVRQTLNLPTFRAKVKGLLSEKESIAKEGEDLTLPDFPGIKVQVKKINPPDPKDPKSEGSIEIEYTEPGKPKGKAQLKLTK
jgi:hypothetical protein